MSAHRYDSTGITRTRDMCDIWFLWLLVPTGPHPGSRSDVSSSRPSTLSDRRYTNDSSTVGIHDQLLPRSERVGQISAPSRVLPYFVFRGTQPRRLRAAAKRQSAYWLSRKALLSHTTISRTCRFCHVIGHTVSASSDCCYPVVSLVLCTWGSSTPTFLRSETRFTHILCISV